MSQFSAEDYLRILAERMKAQLRGQSENGDKEREALIYNSEEVVVNPGKIQSEIVPCPK